MSSIKSTRKFGVSGKYRSQVQTLAKQSATYLFDLKFFTLDVRTWNGNGSERIRFSVPPSTQYGTVYGFPSGTQLQVEIDTASNPASSFLFWHGGQVGHKYATVNIDRNRRLDAVFSGALFSGDTSFEDFEGFPSEGYVIDLNYGNNSFFFPKPTIFRADFIQYFNDLETFGSGAVDISRLSTSNSYSRDYYYNYSEDLIPFQVADRFCTDTFEEYPSGVLEKLPNTTGLGYYMPTGYVISQVVPNYFDSFDYSTGPRDRFDNNYYNFTTTFSTGRGAISSFIKPANYGGYDTFEAYPTGSITNLTNMNIDFVPLTNITGKILPSGG